jgi:hypothetical protein
MRTVVGLAAIWLLRSLAVFLRAIGTTMLYLGTLLNHIYDLPLFVPLWLDERIGRTNDATLGVRKEA